MNLAKLRPGMEEVTLIVKVLRLDDPREITTSYDFTHRILDGEIEDDTGIMGLTVWNEQIEKFDKIKLGQTVKLVDCFISSFKGELSVNVGRESNVELIEV